MDLGKYQEILKSAIPSQVESIGTAKKNPEVILKGKGGVSTKIELICFDNKTFQCF